MIVSTLTYGAESWVVKENEKQRLQEAEMRVLRKTLRLHRIDHVRSHEIIIIRECLRHEGIVDQVGHKREVWKHRVEERKGSLMERVMNSTGPGKRPRGRSRKQWSNAY